MLPIESSRTTPWFFADEPVSTADADSFGHGDVADNVDAALQSNRGRVMVGLLGGFGVGKSSVIGLLKARLLGRRSVLRVSAERHEVSGFHRAFVFAFAEAVEREGLVARSVIESELETLNSSSSQQHSDWRLAPAARAAERLLRLFGSKVARIALFAGVVAALLVGIAFAIAAAAGAPVVANLWTWLIGLVAVVTATPVFTAIVALLASTSDAAKGALFAPGIVSRLRPRVEAADEYERVFAKLVELVPSEVVIAVDDIDRLSANEILPALNAIRSFQLTCAKRPAFIVSVDEGVLERAIIDSSPTLAGQVGSEKSVVHEYLNRLFTHRQQMPPHAFADLRAYARDLLLSPAHPAVELLTTDLDAVVHVLVHDGVVNPRHVIRLLNAFLADYRLANLREQRSGVQSIAAGAVTASPKTIARMAALRLDFPDFYRALASDNGLLDAVEQIARGGDTSRVGEIARLLGETDGRGTRFSELEAYVGRTAGWVEPVDDLLPFIYLGQDEIDRTVGSAAARQMRSILSSGLVAELRSYLDAAESEGNLDSTLALIRSTVDGLGEPELGNALVAIDGVVAESEISVFTSALAEVVSTSLPRALTPPVSPAGLTALIGAAEPKYRAVIERELTDEARSTLAWDLDLVRTWPSMPSWLHESPGVVSRVGSALAVVGQQATLSDIDRVVPVLVKAPPSELLASAVGAILDVLARSDQDAGGEFRVAFNALANLVADRIDLEDLAPALRKLLAEPGSVSASVGLDLTGLIELDDPKSLAALAFDIAINAVSGDEFIEGVDEDYLRSCTPLLTNALDRVSGWNRTLGERKVQLHEAIGRLLGLASEHFSWIEGFTEPVALGLRSRPSSLQLYARVAAESFETYTTQRAVQAKWDLAIVLSGDLSADDFDPLERAMLSVISADDDDVRAIGIARLRGFLSTDKGQASTDRIAASLEGLLNRASLHILEALEVVAGHSSCSEDRQLAIVERMATMLPYSASRAHAVRALLSTDWSLAARTGAALHLANYGAELAGAHLLRFVSGFGTEQVPKELDALVDSAVQDALADENFALARMAIGSASVDTTALIALLDPELPIETLRSWVEGQEDLKPALQALLIELENVDDSNSSIFSVVGEYARADQALFDLTVKDLCRSQLGQGLKSLNAGVWTTLLGNSGVEARETVAQELVRVWTEGSAEEVRLTVPIATAARTVPDLDRNLAASVASALDRWIYEHPSKDAARALGRIAADGTSMRAIVRAKFERRRGPRKDARARGAFEAAKDAFMGRE